MVADSKRSSRLHLLDEVVILSDDTSWVWQFLRGSCESLKLPHVRLPSAVRIRQSWQRFKDARKLVIHWESKGRAGGAILEEILLVAPRFDVATRIIVVTTNPTHEDVVYFAELGVRRVIRLRQRDKELAMAKDELDTALLASPDAASTEVEWAKLLRTLDSFNPEADPDLLPRLERKVVLLAQQKEAGSARVLDAQGSLAALRGDKAKAESLWMQALERNPNYFRAYNNLVRHYRGEGKPRDALGLMQKLQASNNANISRLVGMGEIHAELGEWATAEHYFKSALDRDSWCSGALNGLAEIRFNQGHLDESRKLLAKSAIAYKTAARFNDRGIVLARAGRFQEALEHYTKAQYVLPQHDKSPLLFYNMALCYSRWGRFDMAFQFAKIAMIKEPNYKKAEKLIAQIRAAHPGVAA